MGPVHRAMSDSVVKTLFAMSRNICTFIDIDFGRGCEEKLSDPAWKKVKAEIAHIRGLRPGSARHDPAYGDPNCFDNLLLLCPNHHSHIDDLEPERYTVEFLEDMKWRRAAESSTPWADEQTLGRFVALLQYQTELAWSAERLLEEQRASDETRAILARAMNRLPEREKVVCTLYYYEELTISEISRILGLSQSTVRRSRARAMVRLHDYLGPAVEILRSLEHR